MEKVRDSCKTLIAAEVELDELAIKAFVDEHSALRLDDVDKSLSSPIYEMNFSSVNQKISFITVAHALDFGSGFRPQLHQFHGKGAWNTIEAGLIKMFQTEPDFSSNWLAQLSESNIEEFFLPGLSDCKSDERVVEPLKRLLNYLCAACNEMGSVLQKLGFQYMFEFVLKNSESASELVTSLARSFPQTFDDQYLYNGETPVYLFKKAQLVTGELHRLLKDKTPLMNFEDVDQLTAFVDNVIVACLRKTGCIKVVSQELLDAIEQGSNVPRGSNWEIALRAKSLHAVEMMKEEYRARDLLVIRSSDLGSYLWGSLGKSKEFRQFQRHVTSDTMFY